MKKILNSFLERTRTTMSIEQFIKYSNGEMTITEIKMMNEFDDVLGKLEPQIQKTLVITIAAVMLTTTKVFASDGFQQIDSMGNKILAVGQQIAYWVCIIMCLKDLVQEVMKGGNRTTDIFVLILKYILLFTATYALPSIFDEIKTTFN